ncbi:MAG: membrane protein insertion efficiency factor YidD [Cytophagales bacterium]
MKYIGIVLIKIYQYTISPLLPMSCRFSPTCSEYGLQAYGKHNFIKATWLTFNRIRKCHPWGKGGYDPVP